MAPARNELAIDLDALNGRTLLALAHEALRREGDDDAGDVAEALQAWADLDKDARVELVRAARRALGKRSGRGRSADRGRRATLCTMLVELARKHERTQAFAAYAWLTLHRNERVVEAHGGSVPSTPGVLTVMLRVLAERGADAERRAAAALSACGVDGAAWIKTALDIPR